MIGERYPDRTDEEWRARIDVLLVALDAPPCQQAWFEVKEVRRSIFDRALDMDDPAWDVYRCSIAQLHRSLGQAVPAVTDTFGKGEQLFRLLHALAGVFALVARGEEDQEAKTYFARFGPQRFVALPDVNKIRNQVGLPGRHGRPFGPRKVDYERSEDFRAELDAVASEIEKRWEKKPLTLERLAEHWNMSDRRMQDTLAYYGVDWIQYRQERAAARRESRRSR